MILSSLNIIVSKYCYCVWLWKYFSRPYRVQGITAKDDASGQGHTEFTNREEDYDEGEEYEEDEEYEEGDEEEEDEGGHTVRPSGNTRACKSPKTYIH